MLATTLYRPLSSRGRQPDVICDVIMQEFLDLLDSCGVERSEINSHLPNLTCQPPGDAVRNGKVILDMPAAGVTHEDASGSGWFLPEGSDSCDERLGHAFIPHHGSFIHHLIIAIRSAPMTPAQLLEEAGAIGGIIDNVFLIHFPLCPLGAFPSLREPQFCDAPDQHFGRIHRVERQMMFPRVPD